MAALPRLILLPGLGIDGRIFDPQRTLPARVEVPPWPRFVPGESMERYACRMAETIDPAEPFFIGGVSFGGMVALEIAKVLRPRAVFAIATCRSVRELARPLQIACHVAPRMSDETVKRSLVFAPLFVRFVGRPNRRQRDHLIALAKDADPWHVRHGAAALAHWEYRGSPAAPVYRIHGAEDRVIPPVDGARTDLLVAGAGHIVNVTHAAVVNAFIEDRMAALSN